VFERERRADAPFAAHADAEEHPQRDELPVGLRDAAEDRDRRVEEDVQHQRQPPPEPIGHQAEHDRADGPHRERQRDRQRDPRPRVLERRAGKERVREILDDEGQDEEVEGVERPAEKPGEDGVALIGGVGRGAGGGGRHATSSISHAKTAGGLGDQENPWMSGNLTAPVLLPLLRRSQEDQETRSNCWMSERSGRPDWRFLVFKKAFS
jgi:hypothetical protein